jgi:glycosyltransferase involved in cell wall biosynthesis
MAHRISIVLPTYNQAEYLPQTLDSIFNQTWRDFELIVVNDGSTDGTPHILEDYQHQYDFTVVHQENKKLPSALNAGFRIARGEYLTWTSSDNIMLPHMLKVLVNALDRHPEIGLVYADWELIDEYGRKLCTVHTFDFDRHLLMRTNYIYACFLYRRECQELLGLYNPEYILAEDWEYWLRISRSFELMHVSQVLYQYRVHNSSLTEADVKSQKRGYSKGYLKLSADFRSRPLSWYFSKLKWVWLKMRLGQDPRVYLRQDLKRQSFEQRDSH